MLDWPLFALRVARDHLYDRLGYYPARDWRTRYLCQFDLALSCEAHGSAAYVMYGTPARPGLVDWSRYGSLRAGDRVWVRFEDLGRFNRLVLPSIREPFVLITGESDAQVPSDDPAAADAIARSGLVIRWFATNFDGSAHGDLVTGMPLGLHHAKKNDWIDVLNPNGPTRVDMKAPAAQEAEWDAIVAAAPPFERRVPTAVADFHLNNTSRGRKYGESRADIHARLRGNADVVWLTRNQRLPALLADYARHAFVISPHGRGLDCYRTWEALLMGCVPIVKRSPIDYLYRDLPVAIVDDWDEITRANLERWMDAFGPRFDRAPLARTLTTGYWKAEIRDWMTKRSTALYAR